MQYLPAHLHRHALALNAATWSASALLGPPLGSLLTEVASWRLVFVVGLPPLALSVFLARRGLRGHVPAPAEHVRLNVIGPALLALVVLLLLLVPLAAVVPAVLFLLARAPRRAARLPAHHQRPGGLPPRRRRPASPSWARRRSCSSTCRRASAGA